MTTPDAQAAERRGTQIACVNGTSHAAPTLRLSDGRLLCSKCARIHYAAWYERSQPVGVAAGERRARP